MVTNGGFLVTKIKQLGDRIFETVLPEKGVDAFNGAQGRILYVLWQQDGVPIKTISETCGLAITSLTTMLERMERQGLLRREPDSRDKRKTLLFLTDKARALKADYDAQKTQHEKELFGIRIDNELAGAKAGLKFKAEFPQAATDTLLQQALNTVKGMSPEYIDDGKGGKRLVFKGKDGEIARNPENHLEPFTAEELLKKELKAMGILDEGRQQPGGGTKPPKQQPGGAVVVDVTGARTQNEAQELIAKQLMQQGLLNGSKAFQEAMDQAWKDNNVSSLPMQ